MTTRNEARRPLPLFLAALLLASPAPAQTPVNIGAAAAVAGLVNAKAPGAAVGRVLQSGKPVFLNDHVTTDAKGRLQVLLLDETVFTLGPNSDMVLDEFVYDPATSAGKVSATVAKGVFRFVTGKVARKNPSDMKVALPVGTIGIRGTMVAGQASGQDSTVILLGPGANNDADEAPGAVVVSGGGGEVTLMQPGFGTQIVGGAPPTPPTDMLPQAQALLEALQPQPEPSSTGGGGGAGQSGGTSGTDGSSGGGGTSERSGGETASGRDSLGASQVQTEISDLFAKDVTVAAQQNASTLADGIATWDQVRSIETGLAQYSGSGAYTCTQSCSGSGTVSFSLVIDFGARTFGGGASSLELAGGPIALTTSVNQSDFSALSGNAVAPLNAADSTLSGSQINFLNRDGIAAQDARVDVSYSYFDGTTTTAASGSATGSRAPYVLPQ